MGAFPLPFTISQLARATLGFAADRPIFDDAALSRMGMVLSSAISRLALARWNGHTPTTQVDASKIKGRLASLVASDTSIEASLEPVKLFEASAGRLQCPQPISGVSTTAQGSPKARATAAQRADLRLQAAAT